MIAPSDIQSEADTVIVRPDIAPECYADRLKAHPWATLEHSTLLHMAVTLDAERVAALGLARGCMIVIGVLALMIVGLISWLVRVAA